MSSAVFTQDTINRCIENLYRAKELKFIEYREAKILRAIVQIETNNSKWYKRYAEPNRENAITLIGRRS